MSANTLSKDLHTKAFVLRRTNYAETDRVINLITPEGKISAMAKGVRKEKSKLAGGIELFCLIDVVIHQGRNEFGMLTSAKMLQYYENIVIDLQKLELGSMVLKQVSRAAEHGDSPEYFSLVEQTMPALNGKTNLELIESWFLLNLARVSGEELNLHRDTKGNKLEPNQTYVWDNLESALKPQVGGNIGANEIKLMRLMLSSKLELVSHVKNLEPMLPSILHIAKSINKL